MDDVECGGAAGAETSDIGAVAAPGRERRMTAGRKRDAVLRVLRGEPLEIVARELAVTAPIQRSQFPDVRLHGLSPLAATRARIYPAGWCARDMRWRSSASPIAMSPKSTPRERARPAYGVPPLRRHGSIVRIGGRLPPRRRRKVARSRCPSDPAALPLMDGGGYAQD